MAAVHNTRDPHRRLDLAGAVEPKFGDDASSSQPTTPGVLGYTGRYREAPT